MYALTEMDLVYDSLNNLDLSFPDQNASTFHKDLDEELFNRYSKGGIKFANIRASIYFFLKKYHWILSARCTSFLKRTLDILVSSTLLLLLSPLFLVTALAIWIENPGAIIYCQTRVGRWGKLFTIYKFRSMKKDADKMKEKILGLNEMNGIIFKIKHDPRLNRVGRIIRKLSIDELPQLWNILKGDMSLVGPRPPLPDEVDKYKYSDRRRLDVIPGLTCIWQVSGRSEIDFEEQVELDVAYIENQSFGEDIKLLLKTIPAVLNCKGAY